MCFISYSIKNGLKEKKDTQLRSYKSNFHLQGGSYKVGYFPSIFLNDWLYTTENGNFWGCFVNTLCPWPPILENRNYKCFILWIRTPSNKKSLYFLFHLKFYICWAALWNVYIYFCRDFIMLAAVFWLWTLWKRNSIF